MQMIKKPKVENNVDDLRDFFDNCIATIGVKEKPTREQVKFCVKVSELFFQCLENPDLFDFLFGTDRTDMN